MHVDHSPTQMEIRCVESDTPVPKLPLMAEPCQMAISQVLIVTGGVSPDPNNLAYGSAEWEDLDPEPLSLHCCNSILLTPQKSFYLVPALGYTITQHIFYQSDTFIAILCKRREAIPSPDAWSSPTQAFDRRKSGKLVQSRKFYKSVFFGTPCTKLDFLSTTKFNMTRYIASTILNHTAMPFFASLTLFLF